MSIMPRMGRCFECGHDHGTLGGVSPDDERFLIANNELRAQVESISLECIQLRNQLPAWIPCSVKLPENDSFVLIWNGASATEAWFVIEEDDGTFRDTGDVGEYSGVTHWMPLPEGPKDGNA